MSEEIYRPPSSSLAPDENKDSRVIRTKKPFLIRSWKGEVPLWKTIVLINIVGYVLAFIISVSGFAIAVQMTSNLIVGIVYQQILMLGFGVFCIVSVWRASSNCSILVAGILAKIWIILFTIYLAASALLAFLPLAQSIK